MQSICSYHVCCLSSMTKNGQLQKCQQKREKSSIKIKKRNAHKNDWITTLTSRRRRWLLTKYIFRAKIKCISWMRSYNFSLCIKITLKRKKYTTDCVSERSCSCSWLAINREASIKMEITVNAKCCCSCCSCCLHEYAQELIHKQAWNQREN